jgi:hypothetical protein
MKMTIRWNRFASYPLPLSLVLILCLYPEGTSLYMILLGHTGSDADPITNPRIRNPTAVQTGGP